MNEKLGQNRDHPAEPQHQQSATALLSATPPGIDDPIALGDLLNQEELLLLHAARDLGCHLTLIDARGALIVGSGDGLRLAALARSLGQKPSLVALPSDGQDYLCSTLWHGGEPLGLVAVGPLPGPSDGRARILRIAHYLLRLAETLVSGALRRTLTTRVHLAHVDEAYAELQQKTQRLEQAIQRMKDSDRVKANFLATVSHELRTPLTSVLGYSEMLLEGLAGPLNKEQCDYLNTVMAKGEQLLGLITTLLDVSRIETVGVHLLRTQVGLSELCRDVLETVAPQGRRKRLNIHADLPPELLLLDGDRDKLRQVLLNLVGNAIKFTPQNGEIRLTAQNLLPSELPERARSAEVPPVDGESPPLPPLPAIAPEAWVEVTVSDNGIGIPPHLHGKVFDAFYQVDSSATRQYEGSGLGLAIVQKFVEAHGGRVWVENGSTGGTVFHVLLPAVLAPSL